MTYDGTTNKLYAVAFDLESVDINGGELTVTELGLYSIDPATGVATLVGAQNICSFLALAVSPEGELLALDSNGSLWLVDKATGKPLMDIGYAYDVPAGLQSMAFDKSNGVLYWAGFSISEDGFTGSGYFGKFDIKADGAWYTKIGSMQFNSEIVGLYIDSDPIAKTAPDAVTDLKVAVASGGVGKATLTWVNPSKLYGGGELAGSFKVNIYRNDEKVATVDNCAVGAPGSWTDEQVRLWTIFDNDNDGQTWYVEDNYGGTDDAFMKYFPDNLLHPDVAGDDWFISAPINLSKDKFYAVCYSLRILNGDLFPLSYKMACGKGISPANMTQVLVDSVKTVNKGSQVFVDYVVHFSVAEDGDYNIGFNACNAVMAQFTNITVKEILPVDLAVTDIDGIPAPVAKERSIYNVEVYNNGGDEVSAYELMLVDGQGEELSSLVITIPLGVQEKRVIPISWIHEAEGDITLKAVVSAYDDGDESNNTSNPLELTVLKPGKWYDLTDGTQEAGTTPFYLDYPHSAVQTIYTKEMVGAEVGSIEGLMLYYNLYNDIPTEDFKAKVYLANTELPCFFKDISEPVAMDQFTLVYDGLIHLPTGQNVVFIPFKTPFDYTGENICLFTVQESAGGNLIVRWHSKYDVEDEDYHMLLYRGSTPFTFAQTMTAYQDVANISFYQPADGSGVENVVVDSSNDEPVRWYNLQGVSVNGDKLAPGVYLRRQGSSATKVLVK